MRSDGPLHSSDSSEHSHRMPIRAPNRQGSGDEQTALLTDDEERNAAHNSKNGNFQGNGLTNGDHVSGSIGYGAIKHKTRGTSDLKSKHRFEISEKLRTFDVDDFEQYRRPEQDIKDCKDKKMKAFLSDQNSRLNDWLEVDAGSHLFRQRFRR